MWFAGTPDEVASAEGSFTADYLSGRRRASRCLRLAASPNEAPSNSPVSSRENNLKNEQPVR